LHMSAPQMDSLARLVRIAVGNQYKYLRILPNGGMEVYDRIHASGKAFLSMVVDAAGNRVYFQYDAHFRLVSLMDVVGQVTTIEYASENPDTPTYYYRVSKVHDPFGRSA